MSVQVSYKKQTIFFIILIFITLVIAEGFVRSSFLFNEYDCDFIKQGLFKDLTNFEKESLCSEYSKIEYDIVGPLRLLVPQQGYHININSDGFRGSELNFQDDDYKIFFLGGSTAFGGGSTTDNNTIPAILEKKLKDVELNVKVVNAGLPGSRSIEERYYIEKYIIDYSPDMIIMYDGWNDGLSYNYTYEEFKTQSFYAINNIQRDTTATQTGIITFFDKINYKTGLVVLQALRDFAFDQNKASEVIPEEINLKAHTFTVEKNLQNNWSEICKMGEEYNFQTINMLQPILGTSDRIISDGEKNYNATERELNLMAFKLNDTEYYPCDKVYDLRNVFDGMDGIPIYFDLGHMSDFGNQIIANNIYEKILPIVLEDISK